MMFATFNGKNFPTAFYSEDVHGDRIPPEAIEITDEQWVELYTYQGSRKFVDGAVMEYTPEPVAPDVVSSRQFFLQLALAGLTDQVSAWVATQYPLVQIAFNKSATFRRDDEMLVLGFDALGFTVEQVDAFFTEAAAL